MDLPGGADENGAYLLADNPNLKERLYLTKVLKHLKDDKALGGKYKLLILDATQVESHEPLALHNDFVRRLNELDGAIAEDDHLAVICASDVNQRSWVSEELQKSIFAQAVLEGLRGAAGDPNNPSITALDLYNYVNSRVENWSRENRQAPQT